MRSITQFPKTQRKLLGMICKVRQQQSETRKTLPFSPRGMFKYRCRKSRNGSVEDTLVTLLHVVLLHSD